MLPGNPPTATEPIPPSYWMTALSSPSYWMSVGASALGQILFLGEAFGGRWYHWIAAVGLAAFAEATMSSASDKSAKHRTKRRAWKAMLLFAVVIACYGAAMNLIHFWSTRPMMGAFFAGATLAGFTLHIIDAHTEAAAYLRERAEWQSDRARAARPEPPVVRRDRPAPRTEAVRIPQSAAPTPPAPVVTAPRAAAVPEPEVPAASVERSAVVRPIGSAKGLSQREEAYRWFAEKVDAAGGDLTAVSGPDIAARFDADHLKKKITDFRQRYQRENAPAAVNE